MDLGQAAKTRLAASAALRNYDDALCRATLEAMFDGQPEVQERYDKRGMEYCLEDCQYHLTYLEQAVSSGKPELFSDYLQWAHSMLASYNVPENDLALQIRCLGDVVENYILDADQVAAIRAMISPGLEVLEEATAGTDFAAPARAKLSTLAQAYLDALLASNRREATTLIMAAAESGISIKSIYLDVFQPVQQEIGRLWQYNKISVAQEHYCTAVTQHAMAQLYPRIFEGERSGRVVVAASVAGELHELGIRMVSDFFEMEGWDSFYLGANTPTSGILLMIEQRRANVLALSATITPHVRHVEDIIRQVRDADFPDLKIIVGGYPFNLSPQLYKEIGADAFASDAEAAILQANKLVPDPRR